MKKLMIVLVLAAAISTSCNNAGSEASASPTKTADSAAKVAPDTLKAAPVDSAKTDTTKH